nr:MAG TPA: helix-turn-helix domain protein [Caudoviricetes sp.]
MGKEEPVNERVKAIRKDKMLSGEKFGEKIGVKRSAISKIESGLVGLSESNIKAICREFDVNEEWLRYGKGEMYLKLDREDEIAKLTKELLSEEEDSFKNRLISALANLSKEQWEVLNSIAEQLTKKD